MITLRTALALAAVSAAAASQPDSDPACPVPSSQSTSDSSAEDVADYVVVGGGTAGCALVARLCTQLPHRTFALLERGMPRDGTDEHLVRSVWQTWTAWATPSVTESWLSAPNPGLLNNSVPVLSGNTLGGSSSINAAQWTRPAGSVPASWGVDGLTAEVADRMFARSRAQLRVDVPPLELQQTYTREILAAAAATGIMELDDPAGASQDSIWANRLYSDPGGRRRDSFTAYLSPLLGPGGACADNVRLIQGATVSKVVTRGSRAVAVEYLATGDRDAAAGERASARTIAARREVISSAGPYHSPKLLQLSGIGPAALLKERGVPLVADLPVGESAQVRTRGCQIVLPSQQCLLSACSRPTGPCLTRKFTKRCYIVRVCARSQTHWWTCTAAVQHARGHAYCMTVLRSAFVASEAAPRFYNFMEAQPLHMVHQTRFARPDARCVCAGAPQLDLAARIPRRAPRARKQLDVRPVRGSARAV